MKYDPIAYTYEADHHCPACAEARFGRGSFGHIAETATDREGNPVGVIAPWDEWCNSDEPYRYQRQTLVCGTCATVIDTYEPMARHAPTDECDGRPFVAAWVTDARGTRIPAGGSRCSECEQDLCPCELGAGHDCEA